jgi:hypothetical protein
MRQWPERAWKAVTAAVLLAVAALFVALVSYLLSTI